MQKTINEILQEYFSDKPVHRVFIMGPTVRKQPWSESFLDLLVELDYENGADYFVFYDMRVKINKLIPHKRVEVISANGLSPYIKPIIDREKKLVYERKTL